MFTAGRRRLWLNVLYKKPKERASLRKVALLRLNALKHSVGHSVDASTSGNHWRRAAAARVWNSCVQLVIDRWLNIIEVDQLCGAQQHQDRETWFSLSWIIKHNIIFELKVFSSHTQSPTSSSSSSSSSPPLLSTRRNNVGSAGPYPSRQEVFTLQQQRQQHRTWNQSHEGKNLSEAKRREVLQQTGWSPQRLHLNIQERSCTSVCSCSLNIQLN